MQSLDPPSQLPETGRDDYELYAEDGEFVLSVEMPGFDVADLGPSWDDGVLDIAAEHDDDDRGPRGRR
jgi:HSP20 family protein